MTDIDNERERTLVLLGWEEGWEAHEAFARMNARRLEPDAVIAGGYVR